MKNYIFTTILVLLFAGISFGQQKQLDKLRSLVSKGKFEKAQIYCDKVTSGLSEKKSQRFYAILARGYYNKKMYVEAAEQVMQSNDKKLAKKIADELVDDDQIMAADLYLKAEKFDKAVELYFKNKKYDKAAENSDLPAKNIEYGNSLFDKGKIEEALLFYAKAKNKGELFKNSKVLDYLYAKKDYKTVYKIQNYKEGSFNMDIQGSVFNIMVKNGESIEFMKEFMNDKHIYNNKQDEVILSAYANNKMFDKLEKYCMNLDELNQKIAFAFIANNEKDENPELSAWANSKLGKTLLVNDLLSTYLIKEAKIYSKNMESKVNNSRLLTEFISKTKSKVEKCNTKYCEAVKYAKNISFNKSSDLKSNDAGLSDEYMKISSFLEDVEKKCK